MEKTKVCGKCNSELAKDKFSKDKSTKDGLDRKCKNCHKKYLEENKEAIAKQRKQHYEKNRERIINDKRQYYHGNKGVLLEQKRQYYLDNRVTILEDKKQYKEDHVEAITKYQARYRKDNKEACTEYHKEYSKCHLNESRIHGQKRKARKHMLLSTLTIKQWESIKLYFNNACCYCGKESPLAQEHFIPIVKLGSYDHNNIIPACKSCNSSKGPRSFFEWYPKYRYYSKKRERIILEYLNYDKQNNQQLSIL